MATTNNDVRLKFPHRRPLLRWQGLPASAKPLLQPLQTSWHRPWPDPSSCFLWGSKTTMISQPRSAKTTLRAPRASPQPFRGGEVLLGIPACLWVFPRRGSPDCSLSPPAPAHLGLGSGFQLLQLFGSCFNGSSGSE